MTGGKGLIRRMTNLLILLLVLLSACRAEDDPAPTPLPTEENILPVTGNEGPAQASALLHFAQVVSRGPGWLVVYNQQDGDLGPVVGFSALNAGENKDVVVDIDRAAATEVLYAVVHIDEGTTGVFEYPGADRQANYPGAMAPTYREVSLDEEIARLAYIRITDTDIQDGEIKVDEVVSPGPGWLAIYAREAGGLGQPVGYISVGEGSHRDALVNVDPGKAAGELFAILHSDAGKLGVFEYPGPDELVRNGGLLVGTHLNAPAQASAPSTSIAEAPVRETSAQPAAPTPRETATREQTQAARTAPASQGGQLNQLLSVQDQALSNDLVQVEQVSSSGPGWVVIYNQANNNVGEVIGYTAVEGGEERDVQVKVDTNKVTPTLYAVLHIDAGVPGEAEFPSPDKPAVNGPQVVVASFKADTASAGTESPSPVQAASVKVTDQEIKEGEVTIDEVVSSGPGWLVIYTEVFDQPGEILGYAAVEAGQARDVAVPIDAGKATGDLFVVLHEDTGAVGTFEYPGADEPVGSGGERVQSAFRAAAAQEAATTSPPAASHVHPTAQASATASSAATASATEPASAPGAAGNQPSLQVEDQVIRGGVVRVPYAYSLVPGFMTIHNQNTAGAVGPIIGWASMGRGETRDLLVKIDVSKATETLYAMLHEDDDPKMILEFPGPDEPILVDGKAVALPFKVTGGLAGTDVNIDTTGGEVQRLVDGSGMSLYTSLEDAPGVSNCTGECQNTWLPVLATGRLTAGAGVTASKLGVIVLPDGRRQVTYAGLPLYYYIGDKEPGDTLGHGLEGLWFLAVP